MDCAIYRLRLRDILSVCVLGLLFLGVIMVQSASARVTGQPAWHFSELGIKHLIFAGLAIATFFVVGAIDPADLLRPIGRCPPVLWLVGVALFTCTIVLVPHIGIEKNYSRRWLPLGICQVQPSEIAKWAVVIFLAWWLSTRPRPLGIQGFKGFLITLVPVGALCLLVVTQDFGTAALIGMCALSMLVAGRGKLWHLALVIPPVLGAGLWFMMHKEYRWRRMTAFLDPWASPRGEGYHMIQSLLSFSTGGLAGKGLGNGIQKLGYLPEDTTDFIFAVICEEMGLFGAMLVVALYLGILYVAWQTIKQRRDDFGRLLAFGIASMLSLQAAINIAVATVSVPPKGMSLPLISAGGSGLIITCAALGLLYSIARSAGEEDALASFVEVPTAPAPSLAGASA